MEHVIRQAPVLQTLLIWGTVSGSSAGANGPVRAGRDSAFVPDGRDRKRASLPPSRPLRDRARRFAAWEAVAPSLAPARGMLPTSPTSQEAVQAAFARRADSADAAEV
jgi:hypothetical protein